MYKLRCIYSLVIITLVCIGCSESTPSGDSVGTPPVINSFTLTSENPTVNQTITFTISASDSDNDINGYLITEASTKPSPYDSELLIGSWMFSKPTSYTFLGDNYDDKTVYLWIRDSDDNVSNSAKLVIDYDDYEKPKIHSISVARIGATNRNTFSISATDNVGIVQYRVMYQNSSGTWLTYDANTPPSEITYDHGSTYDAKCWVIDKSGNYDYVEFRPSQAGYGETYYY